MLGIVTVNYNSDHHTLNFVERLVSISDIKVVVVDNSNTLDISDLPANVEVIANEKNTGLSRAWIQAFAVLRAKADAIIFSNNDAVLGSGFIEYCKGISCDDNCIYGPVIKDLSGNIWSAGGGFSTPFYNVVHSTTVPNFINDIAEVRHLSGCIFCIPRGVFNVFDELIVTNFFFRGEEWYFNLVAERLSIKRKLLVHECVHDENGSHSRFSAKYLYFLFRAKFTFYRLAFPGFRGHLFSIIYLMFQIFIGVNRFSKKSESNTVDLYKGLLRAYTRLNDLIIEENEYSDNLS